MSDQNPKNNQNSRMALGLVLGIAIGVAIGAAMNNIGVGIAIGAGIGMAMGIAWSGHALRLWVYSSPLESGSSGVMLVRPFLMAQTATE